MCCYVLFCEARSFIKGSCRVLKYGDLSYFVLWWMIFSSRLLGHKPLMNLRLRSALLEGHVLSCFLLFCQVMTFHVMFLSCALKGVHALGEAPEALSVVFFSVVFFRFLKYGVTFAAVIFFHCCVSSTQKGLNYTVILCGLFWFSDFHFPVISRASSPSGYCSVLSWYFLYSAVLTCSVL